MTSFVAGCSLDDKGMGKAEIGQIEFEEVIQKRDTWKLQWGREGWVGGGKVYRFWGGHRKVEYIKYKDPCGVR